MTRASPGGVPQLDWLVPVLELLVVTEAARACRVSDRKRLLKALQTVRDSGEFWPRTLAVWQLHREIAATGRNKVLSAIYTGLVDTIERLLIEMRRGDSQPPGRRPNSLALHEDLVNAVIARDVERARRAAIRHTPVDPAR